MSLRLGGDGAITGCSSLSEPALTLSGLTVSGQIFTVSGTVAAPGVTFVDDNDTGIYSPAANEVAITTSGAERLRIYSSGIDFSTSNKTINFTATNSSTNSIECTSASGPRASIDLLGVGSAQVTDIVFKTSETFNTTAERMRIKQSTGHVGIGTDSPSYVLDVQDTGAEAVLQLNRTDAATAGVLLVGAGSNANFITGGGTKDLFFATNNTERLRIEASGNVGIGTDNPERLLTLGSETETDQRLSIFSSTSSDGDAYGSIEFRHGVSNGNINSKISALRLSGSSVGNWHFSLERKLTQSILTVAKSVCASILVATLVSGRAVLQLLLT